MANYPPTPSFGLNFEAPAAPAANPPGSAHHATYSQDHSQRVPALSVVSDQVDSYTAFHRNRNIPAFSAAAVASGIPPLPIFPGWNAPALWPPGPPIVSGYASNGSDVPVGSQDQLPFGHMPAASNMSVRPPQETPKNSLGVQEPEEGELSEGDLGTNALFTSTPKQADRPHVDQNNDLYNHDDEYEPAPAVPDDDDDAYSPVASPMPLEEYPNCNVLKERTVSTAWQDNGNSRNILPRPYHDPFTNGPSRVVDENHLYMQVSHMVANKSPSEVLKLAENAVLNLMPAKVSFQDYLDEGVSEKLIKRIFNKLRLPQAPMKTTNATTTHVESIQDVKTHVPSNAALSTKPATKGVEQSKPASDSAVAIRKNNLNNSTANSKALPVTSGKSSKAEERKDMIARLMAEKANKKSTVSPVTTAPPQSTTLGGPAAASQTSAKIDKEQLLRQKLEALRKTREARVANTVQNLESTPQQPSGSASAAPQTMPSNTTNSPTSEHQLTPTQMPVRTSSELRLQTSAPTAPSIPGLFLASTASPHPSPNQVSTIMDPFQLSTQRKRPVASDFNEPTPSIGAYKRPFGHSRYDQRLVIDVSDDDDDEESDMDIDEPSDDSSITPIVQQGNANVKNIRDQPPLTDVPSRKVVTKPVPSTSSPSTPQGNYGASITAGSDRIKMHEQAILEMRKKIVEAEARKKAKQAQSGTQTPHSIASSSASEKATETNIAQKVADSVRIEQMIDDVNRVVDLEKQKLADEQQNAIELQQIEAKRKKGLQEETKSKRLAELQAEIARHDAVIQRGIEEKRRLAKEMEKLGQEADEQLQADTDRLHTLEAAESTETQIPAGNSPDQKSTAPLVTTNTSKENGSAPIDSPTSQTKEAMSSIPNDVFMTDVSTMRDEVHNEVPNIPLASSQNPVDKATPDQDLELALQHASAEAEDLQMTECSTSEQADIEVEKNRVPNTHEPAPTSISSAAADEAITSIAKSTSMSDGHEIRESEDYEPPEATPPAAEVQSWIDTPAFSSLEATPSAITASLGHQSRGPSPVVTDEVSTVDDLSGFEQPLAQPSNDIETQTDSAITVNSHDDDEHDDLSSYKFFTPYESPLKHFRAFRFHPKFSEEVAGGFRSLTYSHKIQQDKMLCRYELAGGICNDSTCDMQHFRELSIPDDAILVYLGDSSAYSKNDNAEFVQGLREILQDLRVKKAKDFQSIAAEIAAFRSKFLKDSSRVLTLDIPAL